MNSRRILLILGIQTLLVACGGAGSGGVPSTSNLPQFYQDNYSTQATYYTTYNNGACGFGTPADSNVTAINSSTYDNISLCGAYIEVIGDKGTATVKVVDICPTCLYNDQLDLSDVVFNAITTASGEASVT